ncbi:MAG: double zinc ribbon domain-containing protein [Ktedonobacteraceae bacterium]
MHTRQFQHARKLLQKGLDLLFPPRCAGCQQSGYLLCPTCLHSMQPLPPPICQSCGLPLTTPTALCLSCHKYPLQLHGLRCVHLYQGALQHTIHKLKYTGQPRLAEPLGLLLAQTFLLHGMHADGLIPLPLHTQREKQRGYNQATLLARNCAAHLKVPCLENLVMRVRDTHAQVGLNARQRQHNVQAAFALIPGTPTSTLARTTLVIIDDVCTTGATLEACAAPLYAAGVSEIWGLVLGRPH